MPDSAFKALLQQIAVFGGNNNTLYLQGTNSQSKEKKTSLGCSTARAETLTKSALTLTTDGRHDIPAESVINQLFSWQRIPVSSSVCEGKPSSFLKLYPISRLCRFSRSRTAKNLPGCPHLFISSCCSWNLRSAWSFGQHTQPAAVRQQFLTHTWFCLCHNMHRQVKQQAFLLENHAGSHNDYILATTQGFFLGGGDTF